MTKVRKQKKRKTYQYQINRKRMCKKHFSTLSRCESGAVKGNWKRLCAEKNFKKVGLVFDVNESIKSLNKQGSGSAKENAAVATTSEFVSHLEEMAKPVKNTFYNMSKDQMDYFNCLIKKHGNNYEAMSRDNQNYLQLTWRQLRRKIKTFKKCIKKNRKQ